MSITEIRALESMIRALPPEDGDAVVASDDEGFDLAQPISQNVERRRVTLPSAMLSLLSRHGVDPDAWVGAAEAAQAGGPRELDRVMGGVVSQAARQREESAFQVGGAHARVEELKRELADLDERDELHRSDGNPPAWSLLGQGSLVVIGGVAVTAVDGLALFWACAVLYGANAFPTNASVPDGVWRSAAMVGIPGAVAPNILLIALRAYGARLTVPRSLGVAIVAAVAVTLVFFLLAVAGLRAAGSEGGPPTTLLTQAMALMAAVTVGALAWFADRLYVAGAHLLGRARREWLRESALRRTRARLALDLDEATGHHGRLHRDTHELDQLRAAFESTIGAVEDLHRRRAAEFGRRLSAAAPLRERFLRLSPAKRDTLRARLRGSPDNHVGTFLSLFLAAAIGMGTLGSAGCSSETPPLDGSLSAVCDGTGPVPACTPEVLAGIATPWVANASQPGARLRVVTTAKDFGQVQVYEVGTVPDRWTGELQAARAAWKESVVAGMQAVQIPTDAGGKGASQSDLLSALLIATRTRDQDPPGPKHLVVASDGWQMGLGMNWESKVPTLDEALAQLQAAHAELELSGWTDITFCGASTAGHTVRDVRARDQLLIDLVLAGHGPVPTILPSCAGFLGRGVR